MLKVAALHDRSGRYYLADLAADPGWASAGCRSAGRWTGAGATGLGLAGPVDAGAFVAILEGREVTSGRPLAGRRGTVSAFDLTFAAPKSVSVLMAFGTPRVVREVERAHADAVEAALGYVGRRAAGVRRGDGETRRIEPAGGLVAATFTHHVSRALDPHLHSHVVVANLGHGPDSRWSALDGRGLFAHARTAGRLYDAELRHQLSSRLGLGWTTRASGSIEVAGVSPEILGALSSRRAEIDEHLHARGGPGGPAARRVAWAVTRDAKADPLARGELVRAWRERAASVGGDAHDLAIATPGLRRGPFLDEHRFAAELVNGRDAGATRRDVVGAWAVAAGPDVGAADVERCADLLAEWGGSVGVAEVPAQRSGFVPTAYIQSVLGPRPASPHLLAVWQEAASAVERFRSRWGVEDRRRALGAEVPGRDAPGMGAVRLADHLSVTRRLADARRELGSDRTKGLGPPERGLGLG